MFDHTSRYYGLDVGTTTTADGRTISYVRRRFVPRGADLPLLAETAVQQGERIDLVAYRTAAYGLSPASRATSACRRRLTACGTLGPRP